MNWAQFWAQFKSAVDSNPNLTSEHMLAYLRDAIKDPTVKALVSMRISSRSSTNALTRRGQYTLTIFVC